MPFGKWQGKGTGLRHAFLYWDMVPPSHGVREKNISTDAREEKDVVCAKFQLLL